MEQGGCGGGGLAARVIFTRKDILSYLSTYEVQDAHNLSMRGLIAWASALAALLASASFFSRSALAAAATEAAARHRQLALEPKYPLLKTTPPPLLCISMK